MDYYIDSSIWIDFLEARKGSHGEPFGSYAYTLFMKISDERLVMSDILITELRYVQHDVFNISKIFRDVLILRSNSNQVGEAEILSAERDVPLGDALHAVLARDNNCVLITRDRHFLKLKDVVESKRPEDIIKNS